ncbi:MAG: uL15 family ribosomal protein [Clostridia bacterium]|nr:uL15 family ribosomal protein [Clostridia bacterium]
MRRKIAGFLIFLFSLALCFVAEVSAADVYAENIALINVAAGELGGVMDAYADADTTPDKRASINTNAVIVEYLGRINSLRADPRIAGEDISQEVRLLALKGECAGECVWIFEIKKDELSGEAAERVGDHCQGTLFGISAAESLSELSEARHGYVAGIILSVYEEKIMARIVEEDSSAVRDIAERGIADMRALSEGSVELSEYDAIYEQVEKDIALQRRRELAVSSFQRAYELILGEGSFAADKGGELIAEFLRAVAVAEEVDSFNALIERCILSVLDGATDDSGEYTRELVLELTSAISRRGALATAAGEIADLSSVLEGAREKIFIAKLKDSSEARVNALLSEIKSEIEGYEYIAEAEKQTLSARLEALAEDTVSAIATGNSAEEIEDALSAFFAAAEEIRAAADSADNAALMAIERAREEHFAALEAVFSSYPEVEYREERYAQIRAAYERALTEIASARDIDDFALSLSIAKRTMEAVPPLFEERRAELLEELISLYTTLKGLSDRYTEDSLSLLEKIYLDGKEEIEGAERSLGIETLEERVQKIISSIKAIKTGWVSTGEVGADSSTFVQYPAGFDHGADGYWGIVESGAGLPFEVRLSILECTDMALYKKSLREAIRGARISYMGDVPMSDREIRKRIESLEIKQILSIKLIKDSAIYSDFSGEYTVRVLLPEGLRAERVLRVLYVLPDGSAEYFDAWVEGGFLVFKTTHFSDFLILGERDAGLLPLIAALILIGIAETSAVLILRRRIRASASPLYGVIPFAGAGIELPIVILLILCDITLGVYILMLIKELKNTRKLPVPVADRVTERELPKKEPEAAFFPERGAPKALPIYLDRVSAEDADSLVEDNKVPSLLQFSEAAPKICRGCKKTFINVDTISESFERGETVSLRTLKEKGLIPMSACYLKVLARGVIDKPLTVKAQSFSKNAVKMISITGGTAVIEGNDVE